MKNKTRAGFTLIELLVVIAIIGILSTLTMAAFNNSRKSGRDAVRAENIATITNALAMFLNDSPVGYPASTGECLNSGSGVGAELKTSVVLPNIPLDPLWPAITPVDADTDGVPDNDQTNFCYYYFSNDTKQYKISYFLELKSNAGNAGINTLVR